MDRKHNLSELLMTFYNIGWIATKFDFKKNDWNEFGYYQCPDQVKISVKILNYDNIIIRKDYEGGKLLKTEFDNLYGLTSELVSGGSTLIYKAKDNQKRMDKIYEDFED
jgi:hypothetical protein